MTSGWRASDVRWRLTLEKLARDVLIVVLPDGGWPTWRGLAAWT